MATASVLGFLDHSATMNKRKMFRPLALILAVGLCYLWWLSTRPAPIPELYIDNEQFNTPALLPCTQLDGANETLIILRTGATELETKLPVHLKTTLRCFQNHLVFSDTEEIFEGQRVIDALSMVSDHYKDENKDFDLYRRLREHGREVLQDEEMRAKTDINTWAGNPDNPGWKLDKWKFLPMMARTLSEHSDMQWYVFMEADSYILWNSLLSHLGTLNPAEPYYSGSPVQIGSDGFAHGGSGFIVSQPAMRKVVEYYQSHKDEIEKFTDGHWAGDCVLGKTFTDAGIRLSDGWPGIQGDYPGIVPYFADDGRPARVWSRFWCRNAISYHHVTPDMVDDLWHFEQQWLEETGALNAPWRHRDTFNHYIRPRMMSVRQDWDNDSTSSAQNVDDVEKCLESCKADQNCVQYSFHSDGKCMHFHLPRLGKSGEGTISGWLLDRVDAFVEKEAPC